MESREWPTSTALERALADYDEWCRGLVMRFRVAALVLAVLAVSALAACGGAGSPFDEIDRVAGFERGTPTVFVYTDG